MDLSCIQPEARGGITSEIVNDKVYFAGNEYGTFSNRLNTAYDAATNSWSASTLNFLKTAKTTIVFGNKIYWTDGACEVEARNVETGVSKRNMSLSGETRSIVKDNKIIFNSIWIKVF